MRQYVRHPSAIPIDYQVVGQPRGQKEKLQNISEGGLCLVAGEYIEPGKAIKISIDIHEPAFVAEGTVMWCQQCKEGYEVGIRFDDADTEFAMRMVEQVCHVEQYRRNAYINEGRELTSEQAAQEWISRHASEFPD